MPHIQYHGTRYNTHTLHSCTRTYSHTLRTQPSPQVAAQLGHADVAAEFTALAARMHASLDALFWDAQTGAYADFYLADDDTTKTEPAAASSSSSASASASASTSASSKQQASESTAGATATTTGAPVSSATSPASSSSPAPVKHFVRHAGYVALFPLLLRLVHASDSTRLHALLGTRRTQMIQSWHRPLR
jgi:hypothetical protein